MGRKGPLRAVSTPLIVAIVAAALTSYSSGDSRAAEASLASDIAVIAVDTDPSGNSARSLGTIDECVSASVGEPVTVDVVIAAPGVPAQRGIAAYQLSLLYDPAVVWVQADDADMLLAQAAGSNVIPIADAKPDSNGVYQSWGVDFGPSGIEPAGSSEAGPGVIARLTLLPQGPGITTLTLSNVLIIDDAAERLTLGSVQPGSIRVGQPCPGQASRGAVATATPAPKPETPAPTPAALVAASPPPAEAVSAVPTAGGWPPPSGGDGGLLIFSGFVATLGGAGLLVFAGRRRGPAKGEYEGGASSLERERQ